MLYHVTYGDRRVSVAARKTGNTLELAIAKCDKKDTFTKKSGREIAEGRLNKGKIAMIRILSEETSLKSQFISAAEEAAEIAVTRRYNPKTNSFAGAIAPIMSAI